MIKYILLFLFSLNLQAQVSGGTQDVNILSGSVTLLGPSSVTQSGPWGVSLLAGSAAIGSITNTAFGATQSGVWNVGLSAGSNVIGSISNTGFNINGTLPSFASTQTFNIGTGAFVDRTTAAAPYSNRLSDGTAFYDARSIRALTSSDVVTIANPTNTVTANLGTLNGAATSALQTTGNTSLNNIDTKTPALGQTTMAASRPVAIASNQTAIPVTGTFFQATQPVSGTVTVGNASLAVTGPLTDTQLRATAVPISGTVTANTGLVQGLTDTQLRATAVPVSLTSTTISNFPATQAISAASLPLPTGAATLTEQQTQTTALQILDNAIGTVAPGTASTATQTQGVIFNTTLPTATTGQGLAKQADSRGRIYVKDFTTYTKSLKQYTALFTAATTEAILTLTPSTNYVVAANATTFAVSANKILRLTSMCVTTRNVGAATQGVVVRLRINPTGAAVLASPVFKQIATGTTIAIANNSSGDCIQFDDAIELTGTNQFALTQVGTATANNQVTLVGYEYE